MTGNASQRRANPKRNFLPVFDYRKRKVRGICTRNGLYDARFNGGKRYHLQGASNLHEAVTARQVLKDKMLKGDLTQINAGLSSFFDRQFTFDSYRAFKPARSVYHAAVKEMKCRLLIAAWRHLTFGTPLAPRAPVSRLPL